MEVAASRAGARSCPNPDVRVAVTRTRTHHGTFTSKSVLGGEPSPNRMLSPRHSALGSRHSWSTWSSSVPATRSSSARIKFS
eukprot:scaffold112093_cov21-Phaeocystis_antarctica.AAC.1